MPFFFGKLWRNVAVSLFGSAHGACDMARKKMIAGLGNPGQRYAGTRHNVGFMVVDGLARKLDLDVRKKKFGGLFAEGTVGQEVLLLLLKPMQFMNRSGHVVATAAGFYKLDKEDILVVTDDMALEPGRIRIRAKGSAGGHNGLADIIARLGSEEFARLRIGIGQSDLPDAADYVLARPNGEEERLLHKTVERAIEAAMCWFEEGTEGAMNRFNAANEAKKD